MKFSGKNVSYDNIKSNQKSGLQHLSRKHKFGKTTWWGLIDTPDILGLKVFLFNKIAILRISAKLSTPGLPKIRLVLNKGYYVIIFLYVVTSRVISPGSNYIVHIVM